MFSTGLKPPQKGILAMLAPEICGSYSTNICSDQYIFYSFPLLIHSDIVTVSYRCYLEHN